MTTGKETRSSRRSRVLSTTNDVSEKIKRVSPSSSGTVVRVGSRVPQRVGTGGASSQRGSDSSLSRSNRPRRAVAITNTPKSGDTDGGANAKPPLSSSSGVGGASTTSNGGTSSSGGRRPLSPLVKTGGGGGERKGPKQPSSSTGNSGSGSGTDPIVYESGTNGCMKCRKDDDHANLLICEYCNAEYHTYCLDPPLETVPDGDFVCDKCKSFSQEELSDDDGLEAMVDALPPKYTSRYGEVVWAAGGNGFGWWPACIYDPRLTVGIARNLARKHLGKKHLVYFFACHDAPFTVLGSAKITPWEDGFQDEFDTGKVARSVGKTRMNLFEEAMMLARLESDKPLDLRMDWNHPVIGEGRATRKRGAAAGPINLAPPTTVVKKRKRVEGSKVHQHRSRSPRIPNQVISRAVIPEVPKRKPIPEVPKRKPGELVVSRRVNLQASLAALAIPPNRIAEVEDSEDNLFCKLIMKGSDGSDAQCNIGFVVLSSRASSTFLEARTKIHEDLDDRLLPPKWRFYVPKLGPVSLKQEGLLRMFEFLSGTTQKVPLGDGTRRNPLRIILQGEEWLPVWSGPPRPTTDSMKVSSGK